VTAEKFTKTPPDPRSESNERFMKIALREAKRGKGYTSPNPLVGAVAVKRDRVLGTAYHARFGAEHAEIALIKRLAPDDARGAALFVNLEPCCHVGKTPPCTKAIIQAGFARVVISHQDPNPLVQGRGIAQLREAGIAVETGVLEAEARDLNAPFLTYMTQSRPWILLKGAQSLDGRIALANGQSRWITGERSRKEVHRLRAELDAVMVGSQTVIEDDPELTVRHLRGRDPLRIIVDSALRISPNAKVLHQADRLRTWVLITAGAPAEKRQPIEATGATLLDCPAGTDGRVDLSAAMKLLASRGVASLFVEGGGTLHASFIRAGLCDRFIVCAAAMVIGADGRPAIWELGLSELGHAPRFSLRRIRRFERDIWLEYDRDVYGNR